VALVVRVRPVVLLVVEEVRLLARRTADEGMLADRARQRRGAGLLAADDGEVVAEAAEGRGLLGSGLAHGAEGTVQPMSTDTAADRDPDVPAPAPADSETAGPSGYRQPVVDVEALRRLLDGR